MRDPGLKGRIAVVTGGYGVLGGRMASGLAEAGARVAVLGRSRDKAEAKVAELAEAGGEALALVADALDPDGLADALRQLQETWGAPQVLVNAAGGNVPRARTDRRPFFDVPLDAFDEVIRLNFHGTVLPTRVFGAAMAEAGVGSIVNISSAAASHAMTGVPGYSAAKAAVDNFTRWMAVDLARRYGDGLRVNAIMPGFFVADQNRSVLLNDDGSYTDRAQTIIAGTPMGRFGDPDELIGPLLWLCGDGASFVTGAVVPVDGGFQAFSGV